MTPKTEARLRAHYDAIAPKTPCSGCQLTEEEKRIIAELKQKGAIRRDADAKA